MTQAVNSLRPSSSFGRTIVSVWYVPRRRMKPLDTAASRCTIVQPTGGLGRQMASVRLPWAKAMLNKKASVSYVSYSFESDIAAHSLNRWVN